MTSDGTVKNVWGDEPTAEVHLDLPAIRETAHGDFDDLIDHSALSTPARDWLPPQPDAQDETHSWHDAHWPESVEQDDGTYRTW